MGRSSRSERVRQHTAEQRSSLAGEDFEQFYAREYDEVAALAYVLTGSWAVGEDITQDAFVAASLAWDRVKTHDRPAAWVRRVVANRSASPVRRRLAEAHAVFRRARRSEPRGFDAPEAAEFWDSVRRLPRRPAQAVSLHYLEDWRTDEIAEVLGCPEVTVRVHVHDARQALRQALGDDLGEPRDVSIDVRGHSAASAVRAAVAEAGKRPPISQIRHRAAVRRYGVVAAAVAAILIPTAATTAIRKPTAPPRLGAVTGALNPGAEVDAIGLVAGQLWVQQPSLNRLARLDQSSGLPVGALKLNGRQVLSFSQGSIWLVDQARNELTRLDGRSGRVREVVRYPAGGAPPSAIAVDAAGKSVWLGEDSGLVRRVDLGTRATTAWFPVGSVGSVGGIEAGRETLLVQERGSQQGFLIVGANAAVLLPVPYEVTAATYVAGTYFVGIIDGGDYSLLRIDERTLRIRRTVLPNVARSFAVTDAALWVGMDNESLGRVDPRSGRLVHTWQIADGVDPAAPVAADAAAVYVTSTDRIVRLDPRARTERNGG